MDAGGTVKKRNKPTFVCTNCKKRKTKCDRKSPCYSCVKTNSGFSCTYESNWRPVSFLEIERRVSSDSRKHPLDDAPAVVDVPSSRTPLPLAAVGASAVSATTSPLEEMTMLRRRLRELEDSIKLAGQPSPSAASSVPPDAAEDILNLYDGFSPTRFLDTGTENYGPLSNVSIVKRDPWLCALWESLVDKVGTFRIFATPDLNHVGTMDKYFQAKAVAKDPRRVTTAPSSFELNSHHIKASSLPLARSLFDGRLSPDVQLTDRIHKALPKRKVVWKLIDNFFKNLYAFFPFLDEISFKEDLARVVGPIDYSDTLVPEIHVESKLDLAIVAIALFVLRLSYVSLFSNRVQVTDTILSAQDSEEKYLLNSPVNLSAIEVARLCLEFIEPHKSVHFTILQALVFHRIYAIHAPEEGDIADGSESQDRLGTMATQAYALGLHREPDKFEDCRNDDRINHLGRKIFSYLMRLDIIQSYTVGSLPSIDSVHYDVKAPFLTSKNSNISDYKIEQSVIEMFSFTRDRLVSMKSMLTMILDINNGCLISSMVSKMNALEDACAGFFNVLKLSPDRSIIPLKASPEQMADIHKAKVFILTKTSLMTLYFLLFLHYEKKSNFEYCYLYVAKLYRAIHEDLIPYIFEIFHGKYSNHGLILNTVVQIAMHKSSQACISHLTRVNSIKCSMEAKLDHHSKLASDPRYHDYHKRIVTLSQNIARTGTTMTRLFQRYSTTYYYSWKITKTHMTAYDFLSDESLFKSPSSSLKKLHSFQFTASQLDELNEIIYLLGKGIKKVVSYNRTNVANTHKSEALDLNASLPASLTDNSPSSSNESPSSQMNNESNAYIDQMWMNMIALRDPVNETANTVQPPEFSTYGVDINFMKPNGTSSISNNSQFVSVPPENFNPMVKGQFDNNTPNAYTQFTPEIAVTNGVGQHPQGFVPVAGNSMQSMMAPFSQSQDLNAFQPMNHTEVKIDGSVVQPGSNVDYTLQNASSTSSGVFNGSNPSMSTFTNSANNAPNQPFYDPNQDMGSYNMYHVPH